MTIGKSSKFSAGCGWRCRIRGDAGAGGAFIEPTLIQNPPNPGSFNPANLPAGQLGLGFAKLGTDGQKAIEILTGAATPILDRWFESEQLKVTLATDAIIGAMASPSMPVRPTCSSPRHGGV